VLRYIVTYFTTFLAFAAIDSIWLTLVAGKLYRQTLGDFLLTSFRPAPAILFYVLMVAGIMVFVVPRPGAAQSLPMTWVFGALFGFFTYMTFDLTNYAIIRPWTFYLAWTDIAWGTFLTGTASTIGFWGATAILRKFQ
jgi:uncharacterized membrane protein